MQPFEKMKEWLKQESALGSPEPNRVVLATAAKNARPHSRIVAIREITDHGVLFFTQSGTKKVAQLQENPFASMTLWLPMQQRQIILDGAIEKLTTTNNEYYWQTLTPERQLRFCAYAPTSGQPIGSLADIEGRYKKLLDEAANHEIPMSSCYCGFRLIPETFYFYTLGADKFSEVILCQRHPSGWQKSLLSP